MNSIDWEYLKQINDDIWVYYNAFTLPIMIVFMIYKVIYPIFWQQISKMNQFPSLIQDKILRPFIIYGPIYYFLDIIIKLGGGKAFQNMCSFSFFSHHVCAFIFLPLGVTCRYVPWFSLIIGIGHSLLLWFKYKWLEYVYLLTVFIFHYGILQPPFNKLWEFRLLNIGTWILYATVVSLWWNGCSH